MQSGYCSDFLRGLQYMQHLVLSNKCDFCDVTVDNITGCKNLKRLELVSCNINDQKLQLLVEQCMSTKLKIQCIVIRNCHSVTENIIKRLQDITPTITLQYIMDSTEVL